MSKEYDFSNSVQNPCTQKVKKQISINIEVDTIEYFKVLAKKVGIPYQNLINSYLKIVRISIWNLRLSGARLRYQIPTHKHR